MELPPPPPPAPEPEPVAPAEMTKPNLLVSAWNRKRCEEGRRKDVVKRGLSAVSGGVFWGLFTVWSMRWIGYRLRFKTKVNTYRCGRALLILFGCRRVEVNLAQA